MSLSQVRIQSDADSVITRDENDNRMKVPDGGEMVMVESSAKSDSPSVELNVDETEEDDDNDDGYREAQLDLTPEIKVLYSICCLRDVLPNLERNQSNSI